MILLSQDDLELVELYKRVLFVEEASREEVVCLVKRKQRKGVVVGPVEVFGPD